MRIEYEYKEYKDSENATTISHILNMFLALFYPMIGLGNLLAIVGIGSVTYDMLNTNNGFDWSGVFIFLIVYAADILFMLIHLCIDLICEQIVLKEKYNTLSKNERKTILKANRKIKLETFLLIIELALVYLPLIFIGIAFISAFIYALINANWFILIVSLIVLSLIIFISLVIKKKIFD